MSYDLMFEKAIELQNNGALNEAESIYLKMLEAMPYNADVWNLLGLIAQTRDDNLRAVDCFLSAIKYSPKPFAPYFFNLALSYKALDRKSDAIEMYVKALDIMPNLKEGWNYLGVLQAQIGQKTEAIKSFCNALEIDGEYKEARANLCFYTDDAKNLFELADSDENDFFANFLASKKADSLNLKEKYLEKAFALCQDRGDVILDLAKLYRQKNDLDKALMFYYKVLNLDDNNVEAILGVADLYLEKGNNAKAEEFYKKSFDLRRDLYGAYLNYGVLLYKEKRYNEALSAYREAVKLNPNDPVVSYNLALILKELQEYEEALGLMFNAYLRDKESDVYQIAIMETINELFCKNAELALKIAQNWYNLDEENVFSKRLLEGLSGAKLNSDDSKYAKKLFDVFADNYDETMDKLDVEIVNKFRELKKDLKGYVLELGTGTGSVWNGFDCKDIKIDGVDVSDKMIEIARKKGIYKKLYCCDIECFLANNKLDKYDIVVGMDVFCYIGDLKNILKRLKGLELWFSVEKTLDDDGRDFYLAPNGRYKHSLCYIKKIKEEIKSKEFAAYEIVLRKENGVNVEGFLIKIK